MSRTAQHSLREQSGKNSSQSAIDIPLQIAMALAEGRKSLQIKHIEVAQAAISENLQFCKSVVEKMADSSGLVQQWAELCQNKAQRYRDLGYAYVEFMSQNTVKLSHLTSESLSELGSTMQRTAGQNVAPANERRVISKVISFPDRRIATASVLMQAHAGNSGQRGVAEKSA